jgi:hypothetical protein
VIDSHFLHLVDTRLLHFFRSVYATFKDAWDFA